MIKLKKQTPMILIPLLTAVVCQTARAENISEILAKVDDNLTKVDDQTYDAEVLVIRDGKTVKHLKFSVKMKGLNMKLVKFTAPGDMKGLTALTTENGNMYVYLPSYRRVRRIAAHVRNQGFMGTDMTADDMGTSALSINWNATILNQDKEKWVLDLFPKPENKTAYKKVRATVLKKYEGVSKLEYFNEQDKVVRTQVRENWKTFGPITLPTLFTVNDLLTGSKTEMRFFDCKVNTGIPQSAFTKRAILRAD